jgi:TPR repeat protein
LFEASAKNGNSYAKVSLGDLYETGRGVPRNLSKAGDLYRQAAREGEPAGRTRLATLGNPPPEPGQPRVVMVKYKADKAAPAKPVAPAKTAAPLKAASAGDAPPAN